MKAIANVDVIDRYSAPRKEQVPMTDIERKEYRKAHPNAKVEDFFNAVNVPKFLCKKGDPLTVLSKDPGAWRIVVIVENSKGERFAINWNDLSILKD